MSSLSSSVLPMDLLLEISARSDLVTIVRCAAACKVLRRQIGDPAFHPRLCNQFMPMLLRGFFRQKRPGMDDVEPPRFVVPTRPTEPSPEPFRSFLSVNDSLFDFYRPELAASCGLVALRSWSDFEGRSGSGACVFNPITGYLKCIGPPAINAQSFVLLTGEGDADCHYRLVAAELASGRLRTQDFSPPVDYNSDWQAVAETAVASSPRDAALLHPPVVLEGGDAHWLCRSTEYHFILRFAREQLQASVTKIDGNCGEQLLGRRPGEFLLVSDGQGRQPQLLVAVGLQISLWTLSDSGDGNRSWAMQVMVEPESIHQGDVWSERLELRWFGEKSGYVFVRMAGAEESSLSWYFMLELAARRVRGVCKGLPRDVLVYFPYEMDHFFWRTKLTQLPLC
ncbi:hypothetical protein D1007_28078 [Hordeum vulgare]|nr:hypothetical protein D1007_28078 [Hordeum vulgare]